MAGYADVVLGLQYGDEGKARIVDNLAPGYDIVARFNGGANAGHTIETKEGGKVALNQIPSAIFYEDKLLYIGSGCVVNIETVANEVDKIEKLGLPLKDRLKISSQASIVQPHHILIDAQMGKTIGTTKKGIGPCYADKAYRMMGDRIVNIRTGDLYDDPDHFFGLMEKNLEAATKMYNLDSNFDFNKLKETFRKIRQFIEPDTLFISKRVRGGANVLFEGAQSCMLDVTKGSVPYVTSSNTIAAAAYFGGDLSPNFHRKTIGVAKALMSRVGHGPFASEFGGKQSEDYCMQSEGDGPRYGRSVEEKYDIDDLIKSEDEFEMSKALRILSSEYGTVSTRPRRIGALDMVQLNYAIQMNGVSELAITKCDLLNEFSKTSKGKVPLVTSYELDNEIIDYVPGSTSAYYRVKKHTEYFDAFSEDISELTDASQLPQALKDLLKNIEDQTGTKVAGIGVGPQRRQYIKF
ncbi:MAG: adenylosuccinate synthetase [bacterium]|nr:adenylosuccinate synthetase [bacterium]